MQIHPTAIISDRAELADNVKVGPFSIISGKVKIGSGTTIASHVVLGHEHGELEIGSNNQIFPGAMIGGPPQDLSYKNEPTLLSIGNNNIIREFVTINNGTVKGGGATTIGHNNLLMAYVHIAHDCHIGNHVVIANTSNFAGHVIVEDQVRIGGVCSFSQFVTIGKYSYIAGESAINKDILPFSMAQGSYAVSRATNKIGLDRAGFGKEEIENIHRALRFLIMGQRTVAEALQLIEQECLPSENINHLVHFVKNSARGIAR